MCGTSYVSRSHGAPRPRPRWGLLYGVVLVGLAALALVDVDAAVPARWLLDGGVAGAIFVGIAFWLRGHRAALDQQDWCECAGDTLTVRMIPSRRLKRASEAVGRSGSRRSCAVPRRPGERVGPRAH